MEIIIEISAVIIALLSLVAVIYFNKKNNKHSALLVFNDLVFKLSEVVKGLEKYTESHHNPKKRKKDVEFWDHELFNNMEYICYLANRNETIKKHCKEFLKTTIITFHENPLKKHHEKLYADEDKYEEWKIMYKYLKSLPS